MHILVTAASKHGSTNEIADFIGTHLTQAGHTIVREAPESVTSVEEYDAVVIGSAVYMTQWMETATAFVSRFSQDLEHKPVWAFSVGMSGVPKNTSLDPSRIGPVLTRVQAMTHQTFPGRYIATELSLRERTIGRLAGVVEGDFRDWDQVAQWVETIIHYLQGFQ